MRPIDHFFSRLSRFGASPDFNEKQFAGLSADFIALVAPVTGGRTAGELFSRALERVKRFDGAENPGGGYDLRRLGAVAAFFAGEFDDETMTLEDKDWEDIRETLEEISGEIDINTLSVLMGELLNRGKI